MEYEVISGLGNLGNQSPRVPMGDASDEPRSGRFDWSIALIEPSALSPFGRRAVLMNVLLL